MHIEDRKLRHALAHTFITSILPDILGLNDGDGNTNIPTPYDLEVYAAYDRKGHRHYGALVGDTSPYRGDDFNVALQLTVHESDYDNRVWLVADPDNYPQAPRTSVGDPAVAITIEFPQEHPFAAVLAAADKAERETATQERREEIEKQLAALQSELDDLD